MRAIIKELSQFLPQERIHSEQFYVEAYAVDASFFKPKAKLVADIETPDEVAKLLDAAARQGMGVTFRGSGTSLCGQACGEGIIARLRGPAWERLEILDQGESFWAACGVIGADVNQALMPYKRKMGPDPASIASASMGGIVANNAAGMCCMVHQNTYHAIKGLRLILADGTRLDTTDEQSVENFRRTHAPLLNALAGLRQKVLARPELVEKIKRKYQIKNTIGYTVNSFVDFEDPVDILTHLMVGSEGTLGFIHEVKMETIETPPLRATGLMFFPSMSVAVEIVMQLKDEGIAEAAELMDRTTLRAFEGMEAAPDFITSLDDQACCVLIETKAWNEDQLKANTNSILTTLNKFPTDHPHRFSTDPAECERFWSLRRALFSAIASYREPDEYVLTEDVNVPVKVLDKACEDFSALFEKYGFNSGIMGHAFHGNMHFSIPLKIADPEQLELLRGFLEDLAELITDRFEGSLKAEHGTGRAMAPFVRKEWGDTLFEVMVEAKNLLDEKGVLNPGVLINEDHTAHLAGLKEPVGIHPGVDMCVECGFCELACPSRKIALSPRQRISVGRSIARLRQNGETEQADSWEEEFRKSGEELCATDGLCTTRCPLAVDVAGFIRDHRARSASGPDMRVADYVAGHFGGVIKTASIALNGMALAQKFIGDQAMGKLSGKARELSGNRLPLWNPAMPRGAGRIQAISRNGHAKSVVYFPSCAVRTMGNSKGDTSRPLVEVTVELLERAGYQVIFPENMSKLCCGKAMETKGLAKQADMMAAQLNTALLAASRNGEYPVLCDTSPCLDRMRKTLDKRMILMDPVLFSMENVVPRLKVHKLPKKVALHPTCSTRTMGLADKLVELASMCAREVLVPKGITCCGFAGDKGFTNPELNATALAGLAGQIADCDEGYSVSRTCEIGLTLHGGKNYRNILYLVEEATR